MTPNILVVTLFSGEMEANESKNSVSKQIDCKVNHVFYNNLPELEAHNSFLELFSKEKNNYDLFVKVDADTVIDYENAFSIVWNTVCQENAAAAQLYLQDYFTNSLINGLNFYVPGKNTFNLSSDRLYTDRSIVHHGKVLYSEKFTRHNIIPVGRHCVNPSDIQSFHYGFHRGLKNKSDNELATRQAYEAYGGRARKFAIMGFEYSKKFSKYEHEYTSDTFQELFTQSQKSILRNYYENICSS